MSTPDRIRFAWNQFSFYGDGCVTAEEPSQLKPKFYDSNGLTTACRVLALVDLKSMEKMSGKRVFTSGPHTADALKFSSKSFGHFNPKFVDWAVENAIPGARDKAFKAATQKIYEDYFQENVEAFLSTIYGLESVQSLYNQMQKEYKADADAERTIIPTLFFAKYEEKIPAKAFRTERVAFWTRRGIDGSAANFKKGLEKLVKTYTPDRLPTIKTEATGKR